MTAGQHCTSTAPRLHSTTATGGAISACPCTAGRSAVGGHTRTVESRGLALELACVRACMFAWGPTSCRCSLICSCACGALLHGCVYTCAPIAYQVVLSAMCGMLVLWRTCSLGAHLLGCRRVPQPEGAAAAFIGAACVVLPGSLAWDGWGCLDIQKGRSTADAGTAGLPMAGRHNSN